MSWLIPFAVVLVVALLLWTSVPWAAVSQWAAAQQREFQNAMARAMLAIRDGEPRALWFLCSATAAYGVVHAIGPGHGKVLLGAAAFASGATFKRLTILTLASSLAQSLTAILLISFIGLWIWAWSSRRKAEFDAAAALPLEEDSDINNDGQEQRR